MTLQESRGRTYSRRRALCLGLQGVALCASPAMPAICPPDPGPAGASAVEAAIAAAKPASNIPSISYALISCGKVYAANAHGTARPNVAASSSTLYQAASISKTLAAVGAPLRDADQCEGLHPRFLTSLRFQYIMETARSGNDGRHVAGAFLGMTAGANVHGYPGYEETCTSSVNCLVPALATILDGVARQPRR